MDLRPPSAVSESAIRSCRGSDSLPFLLAYDDAPRQRARRLGVQEFLKLINIKLAITKDLVEETRPDYLAMVHWNHRSPAVFVAKKMVASSNSSNPKARLFQNLDQVGTSDPWRSAHAATVIRWIPMNSRDFSGVPSTSRHNSIASWIRWITSSSDRACVWHPGSCGTEAT